MVPCTMPRGYCGNSALQSWGGREWCRSNCRRAYRALGCVGTTDTTDVGTTDTTDVNRRHNSNASLAGVVRKTRLLLNSRNGVSHGG